HPAEAVRAAALTRLAAAGAGGAALLEERLASEPALPVRAGLLGALAGMGSVRAVEAAELWLDEPYREVVEAAIVVLLRQGDKPGAARAAAALERLAASESPADRALVARVIGEVGLGGEHGPGRQRALEGLLADAAVEVRREALEAAGSLRVPGRWPAVARAAAWSVSVRYAERAI